MTRRGGAALALVVWALGCSAPPPELLCELGSGRTCTCDGGAPGLQLCTEGGTAFTPCECRFFDAGLEEDAGPELDAGRDAGRDGGRDAGAPDAGEDAGPFDAGRDSGIRPSVCDPSIVDTCGFGSQCGTGRTCSSSTAPPSCVGVGPIQEQDRGRNCSNFDPARLCACGLFCYLRGSPLRCVRYCDPEGDPCPNAPGGFPQYCRTDPDLGITYCELTSP